MKKVETIRRIWSLCTPFHRAMAIILTFLLVGQLLTTLTPLVFAHIVTAVTTSNVSLFFIGLGTLLGVWFIKGGLAWMRERFELKNLDYELSRHLTRTSLKKFFEISLGQHHLGHSMIKRNVMSKGEAAVGGLVNISIYHLIPTVLMVVFPIVFLVAKAPLVGAYVFASIVGFVVYTTHYNKRFIPTMRELDTTSNAVHKKHGEVVQNVDVIYTNAQEERVRRECDDATGSLAQKGIPMWISYVGWFHTGQWFVSTSIGISIALAGYLTYIKQLDPGTFVAVYMWISAALGTLSQVSHLQREIARTIAPISKYLGFLNYVPDIIMPTNPIAMNSLRGRIEFRDVSFAYTSRSTGDGIDTTNESGGDVQIPAVKGISLCLEEGGFYAFVGGSGAGKSTLVALLLRAHDPQTGHILIDGVDMRMLDYKELRRNIGLVPQEVSLFDGTVRYNITFGLNGHAAEVSDEELDQVATLSRVNEFSNKLERGWDTLVGERGIKLSGGQRQRIGIARALVKKPQILIFDEATSSLDTENEARIRESIKAAAAGKTTIVIAHRLATVRDADKIFVFDSGKLVGQGTHSELLEGNEFYRRLVHNQVIMT